MVHVSKAIRKSVAEGCFLWGVRGNVRLLFHRRPLR
jgi:hypothetical protein